MGRSFENDKIFFFFFFPPEDEKQIFSHYYSLKGLSLENHEIFFFFFFFLPEKEIKYLFLLFSGGRGGVLL